MNTEFDRSVRYPTKAYGNVPSFQNTEEEAEFWDTHDLSEFWDEGIPIRFRSNKNRPMQIRLDSQADRDLQTLADKEHLPKSTYARQLLMKSIEQEKAKRKAS
jgi:hypothetical protein